MPPDRAVALALSALVAQVGLTACSGEDGRAEEALPATESSAASPSDDGSGHDHAGGVVLPPAGDGTSAYEIGYTMRDVSLPTRAGRPGRLSFKVEDYRGRAQTEYLTEQTKEMHVYVVREDLAVFRHVHPELRPDGTWTGNLTLPQPGRYRVVAEFMARDEGGEGDFVMLGRRAVVQGDWQPVAAPEPDGVGRSWAVEAEIVGELTAGDDGELVIRLTEPGGAAPALGEYLGTAAHLTGFHTRTGGVVHMHPIGSPATTGDATELTFHTQLPQTGRYVLFLQVSVDGFLHTLPLGVRTG